MSYYKKIMKKSGKKTFQLHWTHTLTFFYALKVEILNQSLLVKMRKKKIIIKIIIIILFSGVGKFMEESLNSSLIVST